MNPNSTHDVPTWSEIKGLWLTSMIFSYTFSILVGYIFVSNLYFSVGVRRALSNSSAQVTTSRKCNLAMDILYFVAILAIFVFISMELPLVTVQHGIFCAVYEKIKCVCFGLAQLGVYSVFWLRLLTAFYLNTILRNHISKVMQMFVRATCWFLIIMTIVNTSIFLYAPPYLTSRVGCLKVSSIGGFHPKWAVLIITTTFCQGCLLFYFMYPILLHKKNMSMTGVKTKSLVTLVKKLLIVMIICMTSNFIGYSFLAFYKSVTAYETHLVFSIGLLIHLMALVFSFKNWRRRIFPFLKNISKTMHSIKSISRTTARTQV
ncbi:uncharacterized protein LOC108950223 [Ciona intestinalis]